MKGKILDYNLQESKGVISGEDGNRYEFQISEWKENETPQKGDEVDFDIQDGKAVGIYKESVSTSANGEKSKIVAFLLAFFLGGLGLHKFYLGCTKEGVIMLVIWIVGFFLFAVPSIVIGLIAFIESLIYIFKSDEEFNRIYVQNKKCWF